MDQWICDMCHVINSAETFPCQCGYPALHPNSPQLTLEEYVYEGLATGPHVRDEQREQERARRVASRCSRLKRPAPLAPEVQELDQAKIAAGTTTNWQCELCLLASEAPPCICCGFDPATQTLPVYDTEEQQRADIEAEEMRLRDMELAAAAKIVGEWDWVRESKVKSREQRSSGTERPKEGTESV